MQYKQVSLHSTDHHRRSQSLRQKQHKQQNRRNKHSIIHLLCLVKVHACLDQKQQTIAAVLMTCNVSRRRSILQTIIRSQILRQKQHKQQNQQKQTLHHSPFALFRSTPALIRSDKQSLLFCNVSRRRSILQTTEGVSCSETTQTTKPESHLLCHGPRLP